MLATRCLSLLVLALGAGLGAQTTVHFDAARFTLPDGWTRTEAPGRVTLTPASKDATVVVTRSVALPDSIDAFGQELVDAASQEPDYRLEVEPASGRHPRSRGRWYRFVYSRADGEHAGRFVYVTVMSVAAGGRCMTFRMENGTAAAYDAHRVALGALVDGVEMTSSQRLERGTVPLTRYMVDEASDFLGWLVQSPLTEDQRATVEAELRRSWRENERDEIDGMVELLGARDQLAQLNEEQRELARAAIADEALVAWRADTDSAGAKMMLAIHAAAHQPICAGEPPLTRQAVEAFAEYLTFAAGRTVDVDGKLDRDVRDELVKGVAEAYPELPDDQRTLIAGMPLTWAALRAVWPELADAERAAYVAGWKDDAAIAKLGEAMRARKAAADAARASADATTDLIRRQAMLQAQQAQFQMMQNVMLMQSQTARIMASNMGGNTTWVYRW